MAEESRKRGREGVCMVAVRRGNGREGFYDKCSFHKREERRKEETAVERKKERRESVNVIW